MIRSHALMSENEKKFICSALSGFATADSDNNSNDDAFEDENQKKVTRLRMDGRTWLTNDDYQSNSIHKVIGLSSGHKRNVQIDFRTGMSGESHCEVALGSSSDSTNIVSKESTKYVIFSFFSISVLLCYC